MKTIIVNLTQDHINQGIKNRKIRGRYISQTCPVALALKDVFTYENVATSYSGMVVDDTSLANTPEEVKTIIEAYDHGWDEKLIPMSFELEVEDDVRLK